jgi:hypothetical protein
MKDRSSTRISLLTLIAAASGVAMTLRVADFTATDRPQLVRESHRAALSWPTPNRGGVSSTKRAPLPR